MTVATNILLKTVKSLKHENELTLHCERLALLDEQMKEINSRFEHTRAAFEIFHEILQDIALDVVKLQGVGKDE